MTTTNITIKASPPQQPSSYSSHTSTNIVDITLFSLKQKCNMKKNPVKIGSTRYPVSNFPSLPFV